MGFGLDDGLKARVPSDMPDGIIVKAVSLSTVVIKVPSMEYPVILSHASIPGARFPDQSRLVSVTPDAIPVYVARLSVLIATRRSKTGLPSSGSSKFQVNGAIPSHVLPVGGRNLEVWMMVEV